MMHSVVFQAPYKTQMAIVVGRAIMPAAAFQAALTVRGVSLHEQRRLKAGGGQDWPPHKIMSWVETFSTLVGVMSFRRQVSR